MCLLIGGRAKATKRLRGIPPEVEADDSGLFIAAI
jgi:hypothetical protein